MNAEYWQQFKDLFHATLDLEAGKRAAFLAQACAGHDGLRAQVEALLVSHEQAGLFLASSALVDAGIITASEQQELDVAQQAASSLAGQRVGPYQIMQEIGRGGMGTVYAAVRADDQYRQRVAIKLIKRGMDTDVDPPPLRDGATDSRQPRAPEHRATARRRNDHGGSAVLCDGIH
ncbi:MAG: hypothetical protein WKF84_02090 [Pyrinomonadaceae bacterium]